MKLETSENKTDYTRMRISCQVKVIGLSGVPFSFVATLQKVGSNEMIMKGRFRAAVGQFNQPMILLRSQAYNSELCSISGAICSMEIKEDAELIYDRNPATIRDCGEYFCLVHYVFGHRMELRSSLVLDANQSFCRLSFFILCLFH